MRRRPAVSDRLVLDVNGLSCRIDGKQVLVEDRSFPGGDVIGIGAGARGAIGVETGGNIPLDLHPARAARRRQPGRKRQPVGGIVAPSAVGQVALAGLVPALDEMVVDVGGSGPGQFDIGIVTSAGVMAGRSERPRGKVDPADKGDLRGMSGIDEPAFLMVQIRPVGAVPPRPEPRTALLEHTPVIR